jgi:CheY-like chemotaxis protein
MPQVLIVEDDNDVREFMGILLQSQGYETSVAANGAEALQRLEEHRPCVILLDVMMPVMDGWEFRMRQLADPALADIPVVCLTAMYDPAEVVSRLRVRCLPKPVDLPVLLDAVSAACGSPT